MAVLNIAYGAYTAMAVTALQSLAIDSADPFVGWQSARVSNIATLALDYEIVINITTAATAPANDAAAYVYLIPWVTTDGGHDVATRGQFWHHDSANRDGCCRHDERPKLYEGANRYPLQDHVAAAASLFHRGRAMRWCRP